MKNSVFFIALLSIFLFTTTFSHSMSSLPADATADAGVDAGICEDESYTLMGVATNYSSVLWTTSGFGTFDDPTLLNATYTPGFGELGDITLTLTAYGIPPDANASDNMVLTIHDGPEGDFTIVTKRYSNRSKCDPCI